MTETPQGDNGNGGNGKKKHPRRPSNAERDARRKASGATKNKPTKETHPGKYTNGHTKFTAINKQTYLEALEKGNTRTAAAKAAGVTGHTVRAHRDYDPDFDAACTEAELSAIELVEDALYLKAMNGDTTAQVFFLKNRAPERWHDVHRLQSEKVVGKDDKNFEEILAKNPEAKGHLVELHRILYGVAESSKS